MKEKKSPVPKGRIRVLFNTGTRSHRMLKDYTRKVKHKRQSFAEEEPRE